jgi:hypothetical protein
VKKQLAVAVLVILVLGVTEASEALIYKFDETIIGVRFQATMAISLNENTITINLQNTSPISSGPTIYGFGVALTNYGLINSGTNKMTWELLVAGDQGDPSQWSRPGLSLDGSNYQLYFIAGNDVTFGLYNPLLNISYGSTPASLTATFYYGNPVFDDSLAPVIRVGNVPGLGPSNPQYIKGRLVATPEPGTMLLLGLGLIGIALVMREML